MLLYVSCKVGDVVGGDKKTKISDASDSFASNGLDSVNTCEEMVVQFFYDILAVTFSSCWYETRTIGLLVWRTHYTSGCVNRTCGIIKWR